MGILEDLIGGSPTVTPGLLDAAGYMDPAQYDRARRSSAMDGLWAGLLAGGGPSLEPRNFFSALGVGMQGRQQYGSQFDKDQFESAQAAAQRALIPQRQLDLQMKREALAQVSEKLPELVPGYRPPGAPTAPGVAGGSDFPGASGGGGVATPSDGGTYWTPAGLAALRPTEGRYDQIHYPSGDPSTASGGYGFLDRTWREQAPKAGVDITQYPRAYLAPPEVQDRVAAITPIHHWTGVDANGKPFNANAQRLATNPAYVTGGATLPSMQPTSAEVRRPLPEVGTRSLDLEVLPGGNVPAITSTNRAGLDRLFPGPSGTRSLDPNAPININPAADGIDPSRIGPNAIGQTNPVPPGLRPLGPAAGGPVPAAIAAGVPPAAPAPAVLSPAAARAALNQPAAAQPPIVVPPPGPQSALGGRDTVVPTGSPLQIPGLNGAPPADGQAAMQLAALVSGGSGGRLPAGAAPGGDTVVPPSALPAAPAPAPAATQPPDPSLIPGAMPAMPAPTGQTLVPRPELVPQPGVPDRPTLTPAPPTRPLPAMPPPPGLTAPDFSQVGQAVPADVARRAGIALQVGLGLKILGLDVPAISKIAELPLELQKTAYEAAVKAPYELRNQQYTSLLNMTTEQWKNLNENDRTLWSAALGMDKTDFEARIRQGEKDVENQNAQINKNWDNMNEAEKAKAAASNQFALAKLQSQYRTAEEWNKPTTVIDTEEGTLRKIPRVTTMAEEYRRALAQTGGPPRPPTVGQALGIGQAAPPTGPAPAPAATQPPAGQPRTFRGEPGPGETAAATGLANEAVKKVAEVSTSADAARKGLTSVDILLNAPPIDWQGKLAGPKQEFNRLMTSFFGVNAESVRSYEQASQLMGDTMRTALRASDPNPTDRQQQSLAATLPSPERSREGYEVGLRYMAGMQDWQIYRNQQLNAHLRDNPNNPQGYFQKEDISGIPFIVARMRPQDRTDYMAKVGRTDPAALTRLLNQLQQIKGAFSMSAIDDAIADAQAALAQTKQSDGSAAPIPAAMIPGGAIDNARTIESRAIAGTLPTEAQLSGTEAPASEPGYNFADAMTHGMTLGVSDLAHGYIRDAIRKSATALGAGLPEDANRQWGRGAEEYQAARERYAANNPVSSIGANLLGGVMMPMGRLGKVGEYIAPYAARAAEAIGIGAPTAARVGSAAGNVLGGAALGGGMGAIGGTIDEVPEGRAAMLDAALKGGVFGAGVGAAAPAVIGTGLGAYRLGRDYLGPQSRASALSSGAAERALQGRTTDLPAAIANYDNISPFPGFNKSLAQATASPGSPGAPARADPGLVRMEGDLVAQLGPRDVSTLTPSEQGLLDVVPQQRDAKTAALQSVVGDTAAQQQAIEQQRLALGTPAREVEQLGATAKAEMQAGKTAGKEAIVGRPERPGEPAIEGMPNVDPSIPLNNKPVADQAVAIQRRILPEDRAPTPEEQALFDKARMWGTNISFERTNALRSDILQTIREQVGAGNANSPMVARLSELRGVIDKNIENQLPADQFAIWRARQDAFRQQAEIYKNRDTGPLLAGREAGDYRVSETATPSVIIRDNQSATAFLNAGGTPETLRTALITDLHAQGDLTPAKITKWRQDNEGALRAVPGLDAEVGNLAQSQARLNTSQRLESFINPQTQAIDQTAFRKFMRTNQGSLVSDGISPQGLDTLDKLVSSMDLPPPGTARTIGANKSGSPSAYSNMFQVIHNAIATTGSTTANIGGLIAAGVADAALTGGAATGTYLVTRMMQRLHENGINNINQVLAEAAVNPAFGRTLLMANTPRNQQFIDRSMQAALRGTSAGRLTAGAGAVDRQGLAEERTRRRGQEFLTAP